MKSALAWWALAAVLVGGALWLGGQSVGDSLIAGALVGAVFGAASIAFHAFAAARKQRDDWHD